MPLFFLKDKSYSNESGPLRETSRTEGSLSGLVEEAAEVSLFVYIFFLSRWISDVNIWEMYIELNF